MHFTNQIYPPKIAHLFPKEAIQRWMNQQNELIFQKGEIITTPTKEIDYVYLITKGNAHIYHIHPDGKECVLVLLSSGDFIDVLHVFTEKESLLFSRALTEVTVVPVAVKDIRQLITKTPELAMSLLTYLTHRLQETTEILEHVAYGKVEDRLLFLLRKLADSTKEEQNWLPLPKYLTHKDIAGMIASTRETVTFLINKLMNQGLLRQDNHGLWIGKE